MSLMECNYGDDRNAGRHSMEVTVRNSKDARSGYDCRNHTPHNPTGDSISIPGQHGCTSCRTLLFDDMMEQASQQLRGSALNYGSCCTVCEISGFTRFLKSDHAALDGSGSQESETDQIMLEQRSRVSKIDEDHVASSRSSSLGSQQHFASDDRDNGTTASSRAASRETVGEAGIQCDGNEAAVSELVMEKILRDHFGLDNSEPLSSCRSKQTSGVCSSNNNHPPPTLPQIRDQQDDRSQVTSPQTWNSRTEYSKVSQEAGSPSGQPVGLRESELTFARPTIRRPGSFAVTVGGVPSTTPQKWNAQTGRGQDQGPGYPHVGAPAASEENKLSKTRFKMSTDALERAATSCRPKRRRTRIHRSDSLAETQRMTHIAVERNRRKQMNDHLSALKALMPTTFVQKTDQASIIGGAVEFVKELEVLLESLLSKQRRRRSYAGTFGPSSGWFNIHPRPNMPYNGAAVASAPPFASTAAPASIFKDATIDALSSKRPIMGSELLAVFQPESARATNEVRAECRSIAGTVEVKVWGNDAVVNITTHRRAKQLVEIILAFESFNFNILHIHITTSNSTILYTFNAKVGSDCKMTVNHIAAALHQTFNSIHMKYLCAHDNHRG